MKNKPYKAIFVYSISTLLIGVIDIIINLKDGRDIKDSFLLMVTIMIPFIYSLVPFINDTLLTLNKNKNRLTSEFFTDRKNDLDHLIKILCSHDHRIEI